MNYKHFSVLSFALFSFYFVVVAGENVALKDDPEEVNKYKRQKNYDSHHESNTKLKAKPVKNATNEIPLKQTQLKNDSKVVTTVKPFKVLDSKKVIKKVETETDKNDDVVTLPDFYIVGENSNKIRDRGVNLDHKADLKTNDPLQKGEVKEEKDTDRLNLGNKQEQRYKRTGTVSFFEEVDHKNNNTEPNTPTLNVYVKKDKSINIGNPDDDKKLGNSTTSANKKQEPIEKSSNNKLDAIDYIKHLFTTDALTEFRNGDVDYEDDKKYINTSLEHQADKGLNPNLKNKKDPLLTELPNNALNDESCDIVIQNDNIHEVIERNERPYENNYPLYTHIDPTPENVQVYQAPAVQTGLYTHVDPTPENVQAYQAPIVQTQDYQNTRRWNNRPYNTYNTSEVNGTLRYVPTQAGYPQGYYTNVAEKYAEPSLNSKPTNVENNMNPKVYHNGKNFKTNNPDYSRLPPPYRYPFENQFQDLWNQRKKYIALNLRKLPTYAWSRNYQGKPVGYTTYNPSDQYRYQEIIQPQNYLGKTWRSWRRTQVILKDPKTKANLLRNMNISRNFLNIN